MKDNATPDQYEKMPRYDLTEEAFRRYEKYMARASTNLTLIVEPWDFPVSKTRRMTKASSFVCRFNDAKTAYKRYNYKSSIISPYFNVENLRASALVTGGVLIENLMYTGKGAPILSCDHAGLRQLAAKIKSKEIVPTLTYNKVPIRIVEESGAADLAFIESLQAEDSEFYGSFVCTEPSNGYLFALLD